MNATTPYAPVVSAGEGLSDDIYESTEELAELIAELKGITDCEKSAFYCKEKKRSPTDDRLSNVSNNTEKYSSFAFPLHGSMMSHFFGKKNAIT